MLTVLCGHQQTVSVGEKPFLKGCPIPRCNGALRRIDPHSAAVVNVRAGYTDYPLSGDPNAPSYVYFFAVHKELFVQHADLCERIAADEEKSAWGERSIRAAPCPWQQQVAAEVETRWALRLQRVVIVIENGRAASACMLSPDCCEQILDKVCFQPGVRIQHAEVRSARHARRTVRAHAEAVIPAGRKESRIRPATDEPLRLLVRTVLRSIIGDDNLNAVENRLLAHRFQATGQPLSVVMADDDEADQRALRGLVHVKMKRQALATCQYFPTVACARAKSRSCGLAAAPYPAKLNIQGPTSSSINVNASRHGD